MKKSKGGRKWKRGRGRMKDENMEERGRRW